MDTPAEQKAAKKCHLCEKCAGTNLPTPVTITDMNPLTITSPNKSVAATDITEYLEHPNKN
jgi:hypothetical protein